MLKGQEGGRQLLAMIDKFSAAGTQRGAYAGHHVLRPGRVTGAHLPYCLFDDTDDTASPTAMHCRYCRLHRVMQKDSLTVGMLDHQPHTSSVGHQGINPIYLLIAVRPFLNPENLLTMHLSGRNQTVDPQRVFYQSTIGVHLFGIVANGETAVK